MIGIYDYTVVLTYLSLLSAGAGIVISLTGQGHPYMGMFCLLFCGLCDAFDGMVARTKKNRTQMEKNYGIQIDSLSDVVAFGVLPACIGAALFRRSDMFHDMYIREETGRITVICLILHAVLVFYILAALIRLAYFNVTEEERQATEGEKCRKEYTGLPVTSVALIFPVVLLIDYLCKIDLSLIYFGVVILMSFAFLLKFKIKKPGLRGILIMIAIGAAEGALMLIAVLYNRGII